MKKNAVIYLFLFCLFSFCLLLRYSIWKPTNKSGLPKSLFTLLEMFSANHNGSLEDIVAVTQKKWLRKAGSERWEMPIRFEEKRNIVIPLLKDLQLVAKKVSQKKRYEYAIVLGALLPRVRSRLAYLVRCWKKGVRFKSIIVLAGERPLHKTCESNEGLFDSQNGILPFKENWTYVGALPKTEYEMAKVVFDQAKLPDSWEKEVDIVFVNAPMKRRKDGVLLRPNTNDTVKKWMDAKPKPGSCLVISNQPYIKYQDLVLKTLLPKTFHIETVGGKAYENLPLVIYLDSIARWLYLEKKRLEKEVYPE